MQSGIQFKIVRGQFEIQFENTELQIALRTSSGDVFALSRIPVEIALTDVGNISQEAFRQAFQQSTGQSSTTIEDAKIADDNQLSSRHIFVVGKNGSRTYVAFALPGPQIFVGELNQTGDNIGVSIKGPSQELFPIIEGSARALFSQK